MKFTYVISCQQYGIDKRCAHQSAKDISRLIVYPSPSVRVAYIDEGKEPGLDGTKSIIRKASYSTLVKAALPNSFWSSEPVSSLDQKFKKVKLYTWSMERTKVNSAAVILEFLGYIQDKASWEAGPPILGGGKSENQNHAIIFTRGAGMRTTDMNQDNYTEEALKMRNLPQKFLKKHDDGKYPTILGLREHIFTRSVPDGFGVCRYCCSGRDAPL